MDKASIGGVLAGLGLVVAAILIGSPLSTFINVPGILIVAGGTFAATSIAFPTNELKMIFSVSRRVFNDPGDEMVAISQHLIKAMKVLKRDGPVALESTAEEAPTEPLKKGLLLIADGTDSFTIKEILRTEQKQMEDHHRAGQKIFNEMGKYAPAFGMVGTLIGLVQMLSDLSDPDALGPNMAVALLTTFYGALLANLIFIPMVSKLDRRINIEVSQIALTMMGLESMVRGETGIILEEKLRAFLNSQKSMADEALGQPQEAVA
jgi:chemotaxis protein MotA